MRSWNERLPFSGETPRAAARLPDAVFEMLSPSTAQKNRREARFYQPIQPEENGRLWSEELGVFVGLWHGVVESREYDWVRLFRRDGTLVPTPEEAEEAKDAEIARLRALLEERGQV